MSIEEEQFMEAKSKMTNAISDFYKACKEIDIDDEGFAEDIAEQVFSATLVLPKGLEKEIENDETIGEGVVLSDYI